MTSTELRLVLMYSGVLPFVGVALLFILGLQVSLMDVSGETLLTSYTLIIGSFMAGVHWGQALENKSPKDLILPLLSNGVTLSFWFAFLILPLQMFVFASVLLFGFILLIDVALFKQGRVAKEYLRHRVFVSAMVMLSLLLAGWYLPGPV